jgi:hypothetical protein
MSNRLDMMQDDVERFNRWCAEHSVEIPGNESTGGVGRGITVWDCSSDGRFRMDVVAIDARTGLWPQQSFVYLTPTEARRLSGLLLESADIVDGVVEHDKGNTK